MDSTDVLKSALKNERELFLKNLSSFTILDIGTIVSVEKGRALVHGSSFVGGQQTIYDDAEIIYPGNEGGAYTAECAGTPCLIFIPMSCMPSISDRNIRLRAASYDTDGVKVMPIGNAAEALVKTVFNDGGAFSILSKNYNVSFSEDTINLERKDALSSVAMDSNGGFHLIKRGEDSTHYIEDVDGSKTETWISKDKDVQWVDTLNSDGSRSFVQSDPDAQEGDDPLFSITIDKEGVASVTMAKGLSLETKDELVLKGKSVTIESTDGKVSVTSSDNTEVSTGSGKKFAVNGTNLEVSK